MGIGKKTAAAQIFNASSNAQTLALTRNGSNALGYSYARQSQLDADLLVNYPQL